MVKFLILWDTPTDPVAFERHYREVHIPMGWQLPGLRCYTAGRHATAIRGEPYYWIAELEWDTMDALQEAFQSLQGQAVSQDVASLTRYAQVRSMVYEVEEV